LRLYQLLCAIVGSEQAPAFGPARAGDIFRSYTDPTQGRTGLGLRPRYTVAEGLERLVEWYRAEAGLAAGPPAGGDDGR
jgi:nucleoside-diphosphate-sugar epimerase